PRQLLETATQERWQAHGGGYLQIVQRGQRGNPGTHWVEDLSGELLKCLPKNTLLIVRPDRIVMHSGGADHANELANACMALLDN
ncbi:3-(3-hydroxyphenyl)propionate hydroxylase, partial [Pseudomonas sp. IPO3778]|nr:3-(3-hydroxyphenyl)propionate hydroxylase [Pseudomonas sp. IPO3778]